MSRGWQQALAVLAGSLLGVPALAAGPAVRNLSIAEEADRVVVRYDLEAASPTPLRLIGSTDGGRTFTLPVRSVTGDVGPSVPPGQGRAIVWAFRQDHPRGLDDLEVTLELAVGGDWYLPIPIHGRFGVELDEDYLTQCLRLAGTSGAGFLVLEIDSPGGSVLEMEDMLDLLAEWRTEHPSVRVVAAVQGEAAHAAALFAAAAADAVFIGPSGWIGGSSAGRPGGAEVSEADRVAPEKLRSKLYAIAERRGISPVLLDAALTPARLAVALEPGARARAVRIASSVPPKHTLLTDGSKPLRLTGTLAVLSGFAAGTIKDYQDLGRQLGHSGWASAGEGAREASRACAAEVGRVLEGYGNVAAMLREGLAEMAPANGNRPLTSHGAAELRELAGEVFGLAENFPYVDARVKADFPEGPSGLGSLLGPQVQASAQTNPAPAVATSKRSRARKGISSLLTSSSPPVPRS